MVRRLEGATEEACGRKHGSSGPSRLEPSFVMPMLNKPMDDILYIPDSGVSENSLGIGLIIPQILLPFVELTDVLPALRARTSDGFTDQISQRMSAQTRFVAAHFRHRFRVPVPDNRVLDAGEEVPETVVDLGPNRRRQIWFALAGIGEIAIKGQETVIGRRAAHEA